MIASAESVTALHDVAGKVVVAGSHGGIIAAWYAAKAGVRAVILHDAGIGKDEAGVAGLPFLEKLGMAAAAVSHKTATIGESSDMLARGVISCSNSIARALGVQPGLRCRDAALRLSAWASVLAAMKPTPSRPSSIIRLTAFCPPPPRPMIFTTAVPT